MAELIMPVVRTKNDFEPEITAFYCIYCGYMAADTAGAMQVQYPANVKFVRLPCTGKMDVRYVLEAFEQGADGVYVVACPIGNCHHVRGNERGRARMKRAAQLLEDIGLERERLGHVLHVRQPGARLRRRCPNNDRTRARTGPEPLKEWPGPVNEKSEECDEEEQFRGRTL